MGPDVVFQRLWRRKGLGATAGSSAVLLNKALMAVVEFGLLAPVFGSIVAKHQLEHLELGNPTSASKLVLFGFPKAMVNSSSGFQACDWMEFHFPFPCRICQAMSKRCHKGENTLPIALLNLLQNL